MWVVLLYEGSDSEIRSVVTAQQCQTVPNARSAQRRGGGKTAVPGPAAAVRGASCEGERAGAIRGPRIQSACPGSPTPAWSLGWHVAQRPAAPGAMSSIGPLHRM